MPVAPFGTGKGSTLEQPHRVATLARFLQHTRIGPSVPHTEYLTTKLQITAGIRQSIHWLLTLPIRANLDLLSTSSPCRPNEHLAPPSRSQRMNVQ
jgi:hypothetical protein